MVSDQESREVECLSKIYPELAEELFAVQHSIEKLSEQWKQTPPAGLKDVIMSRIAEEAKLESNKQDQPEAKIISMVASKEESNWLKIAAAACFLGVVVLTALYFNSKTSFEAQSTQLAAKDSEVKNLQADLSVYEQQKEILLDKSTKMIALAGTPISPESGMRIFWNPAQKKVAMSNTDLPIPAADLQYQLWAIVDGKPVDLGVFDVLEGKEIVSKDLDLPNIQAFAVTLEKKGGSPTPNLEQLYVIGNV